MCIGQAIIHSCIPLNETCRLKMAQQLIDWLWVSFNRRDELAGGRLRGCQGLLPEALGGRTLESCVYPCACCAVHC